MNNKYKDGGPAFPYGTKNVTERFSEGMSLRDYFASQALAGLLAHPSGEMPEPVVVLAYRLADKMLVERAQKDER